MNSALDHSIFCVLITVFIFFLLIFVLLLRIIFFRLLYSFYGKKNANNEENIVEENSENDEEHNDENDEENEEENDENLWPNEAPKLRSFEAFVIVIEIFSFSFENSTLVR